MILDIKDLRLETNDLISYLKVDIRVGYVSVPPIWRRRLGAGHFGAGHLGVGTIWHQNFFFKFVFL